MIRHPLIAYLLILITVRTGMPYVFDTVRPILYLPTGNYVVTGSTKYSITYKFFDPCASLPYIHNDVKTSVQAYEEKNTSIDVLIISNLRTQCDTIYRENWLKKIAKVNHMHNLITKPVEEEHALVLPWNLTEPIIPGHPNYLSFQSPGLGRTTEKPMIQETHRRFKKDLSSAAVAFIGGLFGSAVSNFVNTIYERIDPNSVYNRVARAEQTAKTYGSAIKEIKGITADMIATIERVVSDVAEIKHNQMVLVNMLPEIIFGSQHLNRAIVQSTERLEAILETHRTKGTVDLLSLSKLLNTTVFLNKHDEGDTHFTKLIMISDDTILFEFEALEKSQDTHVLMIDPFEYWDNLTEPVMLKKKYRGAPYALYNETANCLKHLAEAPRGKRVIDDCFVKDFHDGYLDDWETIEKTEDITNTLKVAQVKSTNFFNYIYCYPWTITIQNSTHRCPAKPFRLSANTAFETANKRHQSSEIIIKLIQTFDTKGFEAIHHAHLEEESDLNNELRMLEDLRRLKNRLRSIDLEQNELISVAYYSPAFWTIILLLILSLMALGVIGYHWACPEPSTTQPQRNQADGESFSMSAMRHMRNQSIPSPDLPEDMELPALPSLESQAELIEPRSHSRTSTVRTKFTQSENKEDLHIAP